MTSLSFHTFCSFPQVFFSDEQTSLLLVFEPVLRRRRQVKLWKNTEPFEAQCLIYAQFMLKIKSYFDHRSYRGAIKSLALPGRKQATATEDFDNHNWRNINTIYIYIYIYMYICPQPDQEGNKLQRQKILMLIYPIYNHN